MRKNIYQSFMDTLSPDLRSADMSDWGAPQVDETPQAPASGFRAQMSGEWSPGEWDELQNARMTGMPTQYGQIMQDRYRRSKHRLPPSPGQLDSENAALADRYPNAYGELYGDLLNRFKR